MLPHLIIEKLIIKCGKGFLDHKGVGKLLSVLIGDMTHKEYEVRRIARRGFYKLIESGADRKVLEGFFKDCATETEFNKFIKFMEKTGKHLEQY